MVAQHIETGAGVTVAAIRQPISLADQFGVIEVDEATAARSRAFKEKPKDAKGLPDSPDEVLASMGNYVFDADVLVDAVTRDNDREGSKHDMGGDIVPDFVTAGVEGTSSYGAGFTQALQANDIHVVEVNRPDRSARRRQGKSDPLDAYAAARAVLAGHGLAVPKDPTPTH